MTTIVELRDMSDEQVDELLENGREELFNLRFQLASARLEDITRLKRVRREIARLETVKRMRELAVEAALEQPEIIEAVEGKSWKAQASFSYEDSRYRVEFLDEEDDELASALVNLNKKKIKGRRVRQGR